MASNGMVELDGIGWDWMGLNGVNVKRVINQNGVGKVVWT